MDESIAGALSHFRSIPWCKALLDEPSNLIIQVSPNRILESAGRQNKLIASTLCASDAIAAWILFYPPPQNLDPHLPFWTTDPAIDVLRSLVTIGEQLAGFPGACHGGIISLFLDEVTGLHLALAGYVREHGRVWKPGEGPALGKEYRTANLNATYLRPVVVPGTLLISSRILKSEGRKFWVAAQIEDQEGQVLAKAEVLYISTQREKL